MVEMVEIIVEMLIIGYVCGDYLLEFYYCFICGCMIYWYSIDFENLDVRVVNMWMYDFVDIVDILIWFFDGCDSWMFIEL